MITVSLNSCPVNLLYRVFRMEQIYNMLINKAKCLGEIKILFNQLFLNIAVVGLEICIKKNFEYQ